jgi:hypothetical protein
MASIKFNFGRIRTASLRKRALGPAGMGASGLGGAGGYGFGGASGGFGFGSPGGRNTHNRFNPVYDDLSEGSIIEQFMPVDPRRLNRIWRRIKLQDPVAGPAIDLYSELPWSDFQLIGIEDREIAQLYMDALNNINLTAHMPEISSEFLSMGKVIGHLLMDESRGIWERMIIHDPDWIRVTPIPIPGFQPKLDIIPTPDMRAWAHSQDDRDIDAQREIRELVAMIRAGQEIPLPPENTFYIPRRTAPYDVIGASAYTRIIMFVAYEKALVNATIAASRRRASRIRHITAGIDDVWEPSKEELDDLSALFMQADEDPVGAIVVTRTGVTANEVGGSSVQDIVKISDEWQFLLQGKLNALGVSEAFLTGEATYNTLEQLMSVFLEKVKAHRKFFEHALIYEKLLKPLAKRHGFVQRKKAELDHRIRIARDESEKKYILPTLAWEKSLRPVADRDYLEILQMMEEKGIPVTKRTWTSAAGFDLESEMDQFDDDIETTRQLASQKKKITQIAPDAAGGGGMGGGLGGDMGGGLGGDLGGLGGDLGGLGGGLGDMGGGMGGGLGDMGGGMGGGAGAPGGAGGAGAPGGEAGGGLQLPQIGASFRGAAARHHTEDRQVIDRLRSLPIWNKKTEFMGISADMAELAARRLLDNLGQRLTRNLTKAETRRVLSTGNNRRDQVLRYILTRIGVIRNADISRAVAMDIQRELQSTLGGNPRLLSAELRAVVACVKAGEVQASMEDARSDEVRRSFFQEGTAPELSADLKRTISGEKRHVSSRNLLTGFVHNKKMVEDE